MSVGLVFFLTLVVIAVMALVCVLAVSMEKYLPSDKFDERQKIARGKAFEFSNGVGTAYYLGLLLYYTLHTGQSEWVLEPFILILIGILIQLLSFHIYCLMTYSALPLGEKPITMIVGYSVLGAMYLAQYYLHRIDGNTVGFTGYESFNLFPLLIAFAFFSLAALHLIALLRKEKE